MPETKAPAAVADKKAQKSAKPGVKEVGAQKPEKAKRIKYPHTDPLSAVPADFNPKIHLPLGRKDFVDEGCWFLVKADYFDKMAAKMRHMADESKKLGNIKERAKAKRLIKMTERLAELRKELEAQGINVDDVLKAQS